LTRFGVALSGLGFLFSLIYLGLIIYFFILLTRLTTAVEKIASLLEPDTSRGDSTRK